MRGAGFKDALGGMQRYFLAILPDWEKTANSNGFSRPKDYSKRINPGVVPFICQKDRHPNAGHNKKSKRVGGTPHNMGVLHIKLAAVSPGAPELRRNEN